MRTKILLAILLFFAGIISFSFKDSTHSELYESVYRSGLNELHDSLVQLNKLIDAVDLKDKKDITRLQTAIAATRIPLKAVDFWTRYFEPLAYKKMNGPLPVEWETEVFEKFEKPYKREGAGLTLAALYLEEAQPEKDTLKFLVAKAIAASEIYSHDSITQNLQSFDHFYFCNRLYLLNLASIYTTGFECPVTEQVIPELLSMMRSVSGIYKAYDESFAEISLSAAYLELYRKAISFVEAQSKDYARFNHFEFIRDYVNPLYTLNQQLMIQYRARSKNLLDYALNKEAKNIFDKALYRGQSSKGVYYNVIDKEALAAIDALGKLLFYDPILSGNNSRSCASCHQPREFFTDTATPTSLQFDQKNFLLRNTPSLVNTPFNHLAMLDGAHNSLQDQTKAVLLNPIEMGANEKQLMEKILSCKEYKKGFEKLLVYTPQESQLSFEHIVSAITYYYCKFSEASSPFDRAMSNLTALNTDAVEGFNIFMSKAQCGTCHFVPQFNGVKPPFIGSEFEVLGTPAGKDYKMLSADKGRYGINPSKETLNAFRTGSLRNAMHTGPYMHNGVFRTMEEVIDFYDGGGGAGHGLLVSNQTLSADSLHLSVPEKQKLIAFITAITEDVPFENAPPKLPVSSQAILNKRLVGGTY